jgi:hypothetical protein
MKQRGENKDPGKPPQRLVYRELSKMRQASLSLQNCSGIFEQVHQENEVENSVKDRL